MRDGRPALHDSSGSGVATGIRAWLAGLRETAWICLVLAVLLSTLMVSLSGDLDPTRAALLFCGNLLVALSIGGAVSFAYAIALPSLDLARRTVVFRWAVHVALVVVAVAIGCELALLLIRGLLPPGLEVAFGRKGVLLVALPLSAVVVTISLAYDRQRELSAGAERAREAAERQSRETESEALAARTSPHFLFNGLNTVASLIPDDPEQAELAVLELSALLRYVLTSSRVEWVSLREELAIVDKYLALEQRRFGDRLRIERDVDPDLLSVLVPPLVLQPLVENAVGHGVSGRQTGGVVRIAVERCDDGLALRVTDDGPGPGGSTRIGARSGHTDLERRLALRYGSEAELRTGPAPKGGYAAEVRLHAAASEGAA
jgi:two-component system, LytTR family, sensor histidine kinase AlgZ